MSQQTLRLYRGTYERYIDAPGSPLRGRTIAQVNDPQRLILFLQRIADRKGTTTAKTCRTVLASILKLCLRRGVIKVNVAHAIGAVASATPTDTGATAVAPSPEAERDTILHVADRKVEQATNPRSIRKWQLTADLMAFMAGTGCRIGEARMVTWDDVDLTKQRVRVRGTKTTGSDRMNNLPDWLADRLLRRRRFMATWEYNAPYVFSMGRPLEVELSDGQLTYPGSNVAIDATNLAHGVRQVLDEAGFPWAIPHTHSVARVATLLHEAGIPLASIADQLGHADPTMTMSVYLGRDLEGDKSIWRPCCDPEVRVRLRARDRPLRRVSTGVPKKVLDVAENRYWVTNWVISGFQPGIRSPQQGSD